ncbi:hypothetical protein M2426_004869 [Pseudomonas moraviensis]|uniref:hypothetical protein n=1 Tax=Pseudomonas moraviensis TaxID=321662 RepID=UPI003D1AF15C
MKKEKFGIKINDKEGKPSLEVGPHVIRENPEFFKKIGMIAALWAQAEVNLNCLFAALLNTTPDNARKRLKTYRNAANIANAARELAEEHLKDEELKSITETLARLDKTRQKRNRIQHDIWAKKNDNSEMLFTIHSNEYFEFTTKLLALTEPAHPTSFEKIMDLADAFSNKTCTGYTIKDLTDIEQELSLLGDLLMKAMLYRLSQRLKDRIGAGSEWK